MKVVSLALFAASASAYLETRQFGGLGGQNLKVAESSELQPQVKKEAVRVLQKFGPLTIQPRKDNEKDSGQQNFMFSIPTDGFCRNCTVLKGRLGLQLMDGSVPTPKNGAGLYIHHIVSIDTTKKPASFLSGCGVMGNMMGSKFIGSGEDNNNVEVWYTNPNGKHNGGFHIGSTDSFFLNVDVVSLNTKVTQVHLTADIEYLPGKVGEDSRETLLSVDVCGGQRLQVKATGPTNATSARYTFTESGSIILAKGHLHAGGEKMQMFINGKLVCESKAKYGGNKGDMAIAEMTICPEPIVVKSGDVLTYSAVYDGSKHPVRHESKGFGADMPDVMGMWDVVFAQ